MGRVTQFPVSNYWSSERKNFNRSQNQESNMIEITDFQKIGVGLAGFGVAFLFLGMLLLFDKGLLAVGNILFLSGLAFVIGLERTFRFFFQYHKIKGSTAFFGGIFVVLFGYPLIGMIIEAYGFIVLFSGFPCSYQLFTENTCYRNNPQLTRNQLVYGSVSGRSVQNNDLMLRTNKSQTLCREKKNNDKKTN